MLVLSDKDLKITDLKELELIDLSKMKISNCIGCFNCWIKTPGKCVIRDDAIRIYPKIAFSDQIIIVSKVKYGCYDTIMKTMLERTLPTQQPFIRLLDQQTHHFQRNVALKKATIIGYGNVSALEKDVFTKLIERNSKNMNFKSHQVIFTKEDNIENVIKNEVLK